MLGFLRHRTALLMWVFGVSYGFLFLYFTGDVDQGNCLLFTLMVLLFHGYLRGNLLGVDRNAVWLYFMFPVPVENALRAKNLALTIWQMCMIGAVFLGTALRPAPEMTNAVAWIGVCSYAVSAILLGDVTGNVFSVFFPEPIDRTSRYSGGTATGALVVPTLQAVLMVGYLGYHALAFRYSTPLVASIPEVVLPALLLFVRFALQRWWLHSLLLDHRERILRNLAAAPS